MKQGKSYVKLIMLVLALVIASYILYNVVQSASSGLATAQAVLYTSAEGVATEGFVVRAESPIPATYDRVLPTKAEGAKVSAGTEVALSLRSKDAESRQAQIQEKERELAQLELALSYQSQLPDGAALADRICQTAGAFSAQVSQGNLSAAQSAGQSLKSLVLRQTVGGESTASLQKQIDGTRQALEALRREASADTEPILAQQAGYYSTGTDGYEEILTPEALESLSVEQVQALWDGSIQAPKQTAGRLITSPQWYYAALVDSANLEGISKGDLLTVSLQGEQPQELEMSVARVDPGDGASGLLVLTTDRRLDCVSALRRLRADIVFRAYSGLRVPKEAVCYSEETGSAGVYILSGAKSVWKDVELLYDGGSYYLAKLDQSTTSNLWPGDLIILDTNGLSDGKVVN